MASTIQLRTGTGSAVPSALTQGEVAINVTNGLVYYGSGSGNDVKQLESFTHITASGNISASGDLSATGDLDIDGKSHFTGHITASGNISASGNIISSGNISASGDIKASTFTSPSLDVEDGSVHVTADIPLIFGTTLSEDLGRLNIRHDDSDGSITNTTGDLTITNSGTGDTVIANQGANGRIILAPNETPGPNTNSGQVLISGSSDGSDPHLFVMGEITASGNISSSGQIQASSAIINGTALASNFQTSGKLFNSANSNQYVRFDSTTEIQISSSAVHMIGHITASGNISASGKVYSTNVNSIQFGFQSVASAVQGTWYGPNNLGPNNTFWATAYGTADAPGSVGLNNGNSGWFAPTKAFVTDAKLYIQNITNTTNYAVTGALQLTNTISYPADAGSDFNTTTDHTGDLYSTTGVLKAMEEVTITVGQAVEPGVVMYPRFNVNGTTANWRGTFIVNYYEIK